MKIAVVCANIGGIDEIRGIPKQNMEFTFHYYTESNIPFPLPNLNNRLKSKYIKIMMHRFLPEYDAYVWIDGKVEVLTNHFVELMTANLDKNDICIFRHKDRRTAYEEIDFIIHHMSQGNNYLISRYANQSMDKERDFYHNNLSAAAPLYETTLFARKRNEYTNFFFDEWWQRCIEFSYFDQSMFSVIARDSSVDIHVLNRDEFEGVFNVKKHIV